MKVTRNGTATRARPEVLTQLAQARPLASTIVVDNGPEFVGRLPDAWAYRRGITLAFIQPGKPTQNALVESFNSRLRDECLNAHWLVTEAQLTIEDLAGRLQHPASPRLPRPANAERLRRHLEGGAPRPHVIILRYQLDQKWGAPQWVHCNSRFTAGLTWMTL